MQQIKIFVGHDETKGELENEVNKWIRDTKPRIVQVIGDMAPKAVQRSSESARVPGTDVTLGRRYAPSDILIIIVYES